MGYRFGGERAGFTWGIEGRALVSDTDIECGSGGALPYVGSVARLSFEDGLSPSVGIGLAGGAFSGERYGVGGEGGVGWGFGPAGGLRLWLGAEVAASVAVLRLDYTPLQGGFGTHLGARFPPASTEGTGCYVVGRPRRTDDGVAALPGLRTDEAAPSEDLGDLGLRLAELWRSRAQTEWASAPAFTELATHLASAGAPSGLVRRSWVAADDEVRHGLVSAQLAARFGGGALHLHPQADLPRLPLEGSAARVRLAVESWVDGCLQEGAAAAVAAAEAHAATDPQVRRAQAGIAIDEAEHAQLAWDVIDWALELEPAPVRSALRAVRDSTTGSSAPDAEPALAAYGVLDPHTISAVTARAHADARAALDRRLS